jgi:hypothetical protein
MVVPVCCSKYYSRAQFQDNSRLCQVLATALLFGALDPAIGEEMVPQAIRNSVEKKLLSPILSSL